MMRALKAQYFCCFAVMGSIVPYLPVYLEQQGLTDGQIGIVISTMGMAIVLSPVLITLLADAHLETRTLLAAIFAAGVAALAGLWLANDFPTLLMAHAAFALAYWPLLPLQDGLNFAMRRQRVDRGDADVPYHHVRVWGTLGFILPSILLWGFLRLGWPVGIVLFSGMVFAASGVAVSRFLPHVRSDSPSTQRSHDTEEPAGVDPPERPDRLPTLAAARRMLRPQLLLFALGMWLVHLAIGGYYTFYPVYLTRGIGLGEEWLGLIANLGVGIEVFFMLGFGWLVHRIGLRGLMTLGAVSIALRLALLAAWPTVTVAVGTQLLHGLTVLVVHVAPPVYINHYAEPRFRNSMQGFYAMAVYGTGRITGNVLAGQVAELSLLWVFGWGALLTLVAIPLFVLAFRGEQAKAITP